MDDFATYCRAIAEGRAVPLYLNPNPRTHGRGIPPMALEALAYRLLTYAVYTATK